MLPIPLFRRLAPVLALAVLAAAPLAHALPAFPGAEGAGGATVGGRRGRVIAVTNLADAGPGSLRAAVEAAGPRIVVFHVSGLIDLRSDLVIRHPRITIAGQTAPGDGVCLRGRALRVEGAEDVVIRHLRVRPGASSGEPLDGIEVRDSRRVILDHCSISWTIDEALNTWHETEDITVQWCLLAEPLDRSVHPKGAHGYGASLGGRRSSYHHNLFAHATARNPSVAGNRDHHTVDMDFRCSVIFNWQHRACDGKPDTVNLVNNYYKPGPATVAAARRRLARIDDSFRAYGFKSRWHISGNFLEGAPDISADNWAAGGVVLDRGVDPAEARSVEPFAVAAVVTQPAAEAYPLVLRHAGATRPRRDAVDARVVAEVASGQPTHGDGIIDSTDEVGGWPEYRAVPAPLDSDHDGMPDAWERRHGLDAADPADGNGDPDKDGYTSVEEYLNATDPKQFVDYGVPANNVSSL
ncbi:MAG TPA: hypothetical protein VEB66_04155 [Opitutaceae bacterium]|nr:hypothetical protein [Opitutaceae bacterium]